MTLWRTLPLAAASVLIAATASADLMSRTYFVPVVARNAGAAGSTWRTELCISNPHDSTLTVRLLLHQGDTGATHAQSVGPLRTDCSADVLLQWFGLTEFQGGLSVWAPSGSNPEIDTPIYALSVRVYNLMPDGTYGLSVTPVPALTVQGDVHQEYLASGVRNTGSPGVSGFRTSVGVFNYSSAAQQVQMFVLDPAGNPVWERWEWIPGESQRQYLLPAALELNHGSVAFINHGTESGPAATVYPYVTVTDNATGDGRFIGASQVWIGPLVKSEGESDAER